MWGVVLGKREHIEKLCKDSDFVDSLMDRIKSATGPLDTPCWEWIAGLDKGGYGRIHVKRHCEHKNGRNFFVHRLMYMIHKGYIVPEEFILHQCHNRLCCNPEHFKIGDHNDNMEDLSKSGRVSGEKNHRSLLTEDDVQDILYFYYYGDENKSVWTINELVEEFEISKGAITDIIYGRTWIDAYNEFFGDDEDDS